MACSFQCLLLGLFIFITIFFFLPKGEIQEPLKHKPKKKVLLAVYGYALAMAGMMLAYYSIATNMALYLVQNSLDGFTIAGLVVAFTTVGGTITSLLLVQIELAFKKFVIPIMLFGMGLAFLMLSLTNSVKVVILSVCLVGFGQGSLFPIITLKALDRAVFHQADRPVALTSSFTFLGQFLSPIILDNIGKMANNTTIRFQYGTLSLSILVIVIISLYFIFRPKQFKTT